MNGDPQNENDTLRPPDISDDDVVEAMKDMNGYLDITPGDFRAVYRFASKHAMERLARSVKARDVMTRSVVYVERNTPLREVADTMAHHAISGVPVVAPSGQVVGVISEKDFLFHMSGQTAQSFMGVVAHCLKTEGKGCDVGLKGRQKAEDIMSSPPITVGEDTPVSEIAAIFTERNINRVPVADERGKLTGIISRADIVESSSARRIGKAHE